MKHLLQIAALVLLSTAANAAVRNVSNSPTAPVNPPYTYNNLQTAVNAAADGDSLYVHGTNISYGDITITNKTLTLLGAGYGSNLNSNFQQRTRIDNIIFDGFTGTKNIVLVGMVIEGEVYNNGGTGAVNNVIMERCASNRISFICNNAIFRQSLFEPNTNGIKPFALTVLGTAIIQNCVLAGDIGSGMNVASSLWENNIFKRVHYYYSDYGRIQGINGTGLFKNNIFNNGFEIAISNCTFNNNLFVSYGAFTNNNAGSGNVFSTPAGFVNNAYNTDIIGKENYCNAVDYHLATGSAALTASATGTEIGIYGGINALPAPAVLNGVPAMPRITEMNLQNISVSQGGNINVQLKAVKED